MVAVKPARVSFMNAEQLTSASEHGAYLVTTQRGEIIEVHVDDTGTRVRWITVNPGRRPLPHASFVEWNRVFDTAFQVGEWGGVQWTSGAVPYTPTSRIMSVERVPESTDERASSVDES